MTDELRTLLTQVAEGRVDPADAARRLDDIDRSGAESSAGADDAGSTPTAGTATDDGAGSGDPWADATDAASPSSTATGRSRGEPSSGPDAPVTSVRVQSSGRPVRVVADPTVETVSVEGPHTVRREGDTLRVEAPVASGSDPAGSYRYERKTGLSRWISQATLLGVPMTLRVNPELALDAEVLAGSFVVVGMQGPLRFSVTAGSMRASDCSGPLTGTIRAGSARLDVRPVAGPSTVRVESGSVDVRLQPGSDVRVHARAELGEVKLRGADGQSTRVVDREGSHELVVGAGTASFELDAVMGSVQVRTP